MIKKTDNPLVPYPMPESAILDGSQEAPLEPPPEPPTLPPDPPDLPLETIREDGCGSLVLLVLAAGMVGLILGLATGCTTSFEDRGSEVSSHEKMKKAGFTNASVKTIADKIARGPRSPGSL